MGQGPGSGYLTPETLYLMDLQVTEAVGRWTARPDAD